MGLGGEVARGLDESSFTCTVPPCRDPTRCFRSSVKTYSTALQRWPNLSATQDGRCVGDRHRAGTGTGARRGTHRTAVLRLRPRDRGRRRGCHRGLLAGDARPRARDRPRRARTRGAAVHPGRGAGNRRHLPTYHGAGGRPPRPGRARRPLDGLPQRGWWAGRPRAVRLPHHGRFGRPRIARPLPAPARRARPAARSAGDWRRSRRSAPASSRPTATARPPRRSTR